MGRLANRRSCFFTRQAKHRKIAGKYCEDAGASGAVRIRGGQSMAGKDLPIVVVGGGIGGLAAALALSKKGRAVHVLEQSAVFAEVGAGIQLGPNVFKMFDYLGLTEAINK